MKMQIRRGVFETNSSSCHAIAIRKDQDQSELYKPEKVVFSYGKFGWGRKTLDSIQEKASYLYTQLFYEYEYNPYSWKEYIEFIFQTLNELSIKCEFDGEIIVKPSAYEDNLYISHDCDGYVDHQGINRDFVTKVCTNKNMLLSYLFSNKSVVMTGNDNEQECIPQTDQFDENYEIFK